MYALQKCTPFKTFNQLLRTRSTLNGVIKYYETFWTSRRDLLILKLFKDWSRPSPLSIGNKKKLPYASKKSY